MKLLAVYTTVASLEAARRMAAALVEKKLAACAQIGEIESFYAWEGKLANDRELRILFKSTEARYPALEAAIRELHDYELPAIHALALDRVEPAYAKWIEEACTP